MRLNALLSITNFNELKTGVKVKAFAAGFIGFIAGKASYASVLQESFLRERPYSELSQIIRKNRGMPEIEIPPEYQSDASEYILNYYCLLQFEPERIFKEFHF